MGLQESQIAALGGPRRIAGSGITTFVFPSAVTLYSSTRMGYSGTRNFMGFGMLVMVAVADMTSLNILCILSIFKLLSVDLTASTQLVRLSLSAWSSSL